MSGVFTLLTLEKQTYNPFCVSNGILEQSVDTNFGE
jgi:hypothetical protein